MMASGKRVHKKQKRRRRNLGSKLKQRNTTTGRVRGDVIRAPIPNFVHKPSQRELDAREPNNWYYKNTRTINNRYSTVPNRANEVGKGDPWQLGKG